MKDSYQSFHYYRGSHWIEHCNTITGLKNTLLELANVNIPILLIGELGTDKKSIANYIHNNSHRHSCPFLTLNCNSVPEEFIEVELFGHNELTASTFSLPYEGRIKLAKNGSLFINSIDKLSPPVQKKLAKTIELKSDESKLNKHEYSHARIIIGSSNNILNKKNITSHLKQIINYCVVYIPPLREHIDDLENLILFFTKLLKKEKKSNLKFTHSALKKLSEHPWPGNIIELRNFVENMLSLPDGKIIDCIDLKNSYLFSEKTHSLKNELEEFVNDHINDKPINLKKLLLEFEASLINSTLTKFEGNITRTANYLKIGRTTLIEKIRKYNNKISISVL